MQITKINTTTTQAFGMAKSEFYEKKKYECARKAYEATPGSDEWIDNKYALAQTISEQLKNDKLLTQQEKTALKSFRNLIASQVKNFCCCGKY